MNRITIAAVIGFFALLEGCASTFQAKSEQEASFFDEKGKFGVASEAVIPHVHSQIEPIGRRIPRFN